MNLYQTVSSWKHDFYAVRIRLALPWTDPLQTGGPVSHALDLTRDIQTYSDIRTGFHANSLDPKV